MIGTCFPPNIGTVKINLQSFGNRGLGGGQQRRSRTGKKAHPEQNTGPAAASDSSLGKHGQGQPLQDTECTGIRDT